MSFTNFTAADTLDSIFLMAAFLAGEFVVMISFPTLNRPLLHLGIIVLYAVALRLMLKRSKSRNRQA